MSRPRTGGPTGSGPTPPEGRFKEGSGVHGAVPQLRGGGSYALRNSRIDVHARDGYLHIVAMGTLTSLDEVAEWGVLMERIMVERHCRRVMLDARGEQGDPSPVVRAAVWEWFRSERSFDMVAYVVNDDESMKAARVNMTALSLGMNLRAFVSVVEAHRFLAAPQRKASSVFSAAAPRDATIPPPDPRTPDNRPSSFPPRNSSTPDPVARTAPDPRKQSSSTLQAPFQERTSSTSQRRPTLTGLANPLVPLSPPGTRSTTPVPPSSPPETTRGAQSSSDDSGERPVYDPRGEGLRGDSASRGGQSGDAKPVNPRTDRGN